jgi:hypothetical protein
LGRTNDVLEIVRVSETDAVPVIKRVWETLDEIDSEGVIDSEHVDVGLFDIDTWK